MGERIFDPVSAVVGGVLGVVAYLIGLVATMPYATDTAGANRVVAVTFGAVFVVGLAAGLLCRRRRLSRRGLWLTGSAAGIVAGGGIVVLIGAAEASSGSIDVAAVTQTFAFVLVLTVVGTVVAGWPWRRGSDKLDW